MKPAPFDYLRPDTLEQALEMLSEHGDDAKVLAGGQSLVPMLNMRLARPAHVIDIGRLGELSFITKRHGALTVGATTSQASLEKSAIVAQGWPLLTEAVKHVAHPAIRTMGTVGGSIAHADPAAELPAVSVALNAKLHIRSARRQRTVEASQFFITHMTTALEPDELLVEIEFPPAAAGSGVAFREFARRHGDFALAGAAAIVTCTRPDGIDAAVTLMSAAPTPVRATEAEAHLGAHPWSDMHVQQAGRLAANSVTPTPDIHASADYRQALLAAVVEDALRAAYERASSDLAVRRATALG